MISFKELKESDLDLMKKWLNTEFVRTWYGKRLWSYEDLVSEYLPMIRRQDPTDGFIIYVGQTPVGYIQTYLIKDNPDYSRYVQVGDDVAGMDLFIGEKGFFHKGFGVIIMVKFLADVVFKKEFVQTCIVGPEPKNQVAIKAYKKAGFKYLKTIQIPDEDEPEYLMEIKKTGV